jgi:hypothetical protein
MQQLDTRLRECYNELSPQEQSCLIYHGSF